MTFIFIILIIPIYFLPAVVALNRNHRQTLAIVVLNLFGGWTAIGWIIALVWACATDVEPNTNKTYQETALREYDRLRRS